MNDLISRKETYKVLSEYYHHRTDAQHNALKEALDRVPSAEPKKGKWIPVEVSSGRDSWRCSVCGRHARGKTENLPYCHCGAKMEVMK